MNKPLAVAVAVAFLALTLPASAEKHTYENPEDVLEGSPLATAETIILSNPVPTSDRDNLYFSQGMENIDGFMIEVPSVVATIDITANCMPDMECYYAEGYGDTPGLVGPWELGFPDLDVFFYAWNETTQELDSLDGADVSTNGADCNHWLLRFQGYEFSWTDVPRDCIVPEGTTNAYIMLGTGFPVSVDVHVKTLRQEGDVKTTCELPDEFAASKTPAANQSTGFRSTYWDDLSPSCNHIATNGFCADMGRPGRVTPGKYGPPAEGDGKVPSRCGSHVCGTSTAANRRDESHFCHNPNEPDPVEDPPEPPQDPAGIVLGLVQSLSEEDPVAIANDELDFQLSRSQVQWVREFTPARCSETNGTLPHGCDNYGDA